MAPRLRTLCRRARQSVWGPLLGKAALATFGMVGLATLGASSLARGPGVVLPADSAQARQAAASLLGVWLPPAAPSASATTRPAAPRPAASTRATTDDASNPRTAPASSALPPPPQHATAPPSSPPGLTADGRVILNTADAGVLTRLPRVGKKRAQAIVALRERLGRFRRPTDLLRVRGIGVKTLRKMLPHLVLDPPEPSDAP